MALCNDACSSIFEAVDGGLLVSQHFGILQRDMIPERDRDIFEGFASRFSAGQLYT